ncbi:ribose-phosphate diphosphokinase [Enterovibrio sp. ZSDZ42]|uniref:Ribose-phosphate diphosphokinase n=1 Tax=Enterovibrio gelatinilyticus TaxID=2899819 RepID=A0ABT5R1Q5_9GAMM|nr:ribose-phosphate diphosphokinase [Enterovibrio sp. ZSDZ42]MDD1794207.1 ribose-phosphate diphosphokinase [Enterovibrio sp. ZSDZ42]
MTTFKINTQGYKSEASFQSFTFSGGEEHIRFDPIELSDVAVFEIQERLTDSSQVIRLMMMVDALKRLSNGKIPIELVIPYFPYARQDRVCVEGEALSASVMARLINSLELSKVTIWDAHSDVTPALLNNVVNIPQTELIKKSEVLSRSLSRGDITLISPDAGASKKTSNIAEAFGGETNVIQAQKVRNLKSGEIVKTEVLGNVEGKRVLIVDDICDGGRTFIELAKVLKQQGATDVSLFVTHGIFSQGIDVFHGLIDAIYTTDSFRTAEEYSNISTQSNANNRTQLTVIEM